MDVGQFREVVTERLAPMLGAEVSDGYIPSTTREKLASYHGGPTAIALKPTRGSPYRIRVIRAQPFSKGEKSLADSFASEVEQIAESSDAPFFPELITALPRWVIARHLGASGFLRDVLDQLEAWSSQTYEGHRITSALGLVNDAASSGLPLADYWPESYAPVMSNGFDTMIVVGDDGEMAEIVQLPTVQDVGFAPYRLGQIAEWTREQRVAVVLNIHGEILVFNERELRFAKRSGRWIHYVHDTAVKTMSPCGSRELREAVYESCLDVSFARTGGCVAVVQARHTEDLKGCVNDDDRVDKAVSYKARLIARATGRPFHELDRRLRQELMALDGAVVLDHQGAVVAAGAIVQVPGGSIGGGRLAAAKRLSKLGLGVKISADGPIEVFKDDNLAFKIL